MISIGSAQIDAWIAVFIFPLARILAFIASAPLWSTTGVPLQTRLFLGLAVTLAIAPALPPMPAVQAGSLNGLWIMTQQMLIGIGMGFAARIVFAAFDLAGTFIGFQMGLSFATFYDPLNSSQTPVVTEFITLISLLMFLSMNGHLLYVATLAQSFSAIPVSPIPLGADSWLNLAELGRTIFAAGLLIVADHRGTDDHQHCPGCAHPRSATTEYFRSGLSAHLDRRLRWTRDHPELPSHADPGDF